MSIVFALSCDMQDTGQFSAISGTVTAGGTPVHAGLGKIQCAAGALAQMNIPADASVTVRAICWGAVVTTAEPVMYLRTTGVGNEDLRLRLIQGSSNGIVLEIADGLGGWTSVSGGTLVFTADLTDGDYVIIEWSVDVTGNSTRIRAWLNHSSGLRELHTLTVAHGASGNRSRFDVGAITSLVNWSQFIVDNAALADLGPQLYVRSRLPIADQAATGWTISTGTDRWAVMDENPPNTSDFISRTSTGSAYHDGFTEIQEIVADPTAFIHARYTGGGTVLTAPTVDVGDTGTVITLTATAATYRGDASGGSAKIGLNVTNAGTRLAAGPPTSECSTCWTEAVYRALKTGFDQATTVEPAQRGVLGEQEAAGSELVTRAPATQDPATGGEHSDASRLGLESAQGIEDSTARSMTTLELATALERGSPERPGFDAAAAAELARSERHLFDVAGDGIELASRDVAGSDRLDGSERGDLDRPGHESAAAIEVAHRALPGFDRADTLEPPSRLDHAARDLAAGTDADDRAVATRDRGDTFERGDRLTAGVDRSDALEVTRRSLAGSEAPAIGTDRAARATAGRDLSTGTEPPPRVDHATRELADTLERAARAATDQDQAAALEGWTRAAAGRDELAASERGDLARRSSEPATGSEAARRAATPQDAASGLEAARRATPGRDAADAAEAAQRASLARDAAAASEHVEAARRGEDEAIADDTSRRRILSDIDSLDTIEMAARAATDTDTGAGGEQAARSAPGLDTATGLGRAERDTRTDDEATGVEDAPARAFTGRDDSTATERADPSRRTSEASAGAERAVAQRQITDGATGGEDLRARDYRLLDTGSGIENAHRDRPAHDAAAGVETARPSRAETDEAIGDEDLAIKEADIAREIRFTDGEGGRSEAEAGSASYEIEPGSSSSEVETSSASFEVESGSASFETD